MPPNIQRFLPFILIAFLLLFVLPALLKKHSSGPNAKTRATEHDRRDEADRPG